jgi:hypothetical protein
LTFEIINATKDAKLVECLVDMANLGLTWKAENGFKFGYLLELKRMMFEKILAVSLGLNLILRTGTCD